MPAQALARSNRPVVTIKLASTSDELLQCYALRAAVFMGEQQCPYWEEFDGNDYSASHLMLYVDGEPAASMRVRWFSGFAKLERAIILKRYRSLGLFVPFVEWARDFAARKGYPKAYLHGQKRLWEIFEKQGFRKVNEAPQATIAVCEGAVLGGGFGLACVADVTLAHAEANFGMPETIDRMVVHHPDRLH